MKPATAFLRLVHNLSRSWAWPLVVFSTTLIAWLTLTPSEKLWPTRLFAYDKLGHAGLFFGWTWNFRALVVRWFDGRKGMVVTAGAAAAFGLLIEILQYILPINRSADALDLGYDLIGTAVAIGLFCMVQRGVRRGE